MCSRYRSPVGRIVVKAIVPMFAFHVKYIPLSKASKLLFSE